MKKTKRILLRIAVVIMAFVGILCFMFRHELKTLSTLKEKGVGVYTMTYDGDYGFDAFLEIGASSDADIEAFVTKRLLKGLPIELNVSDAGCTAFVSRTRRAISFMLGTLIFCMPRFASLYQS